MADDGHHVGYIPRNLTKKIREFRRLPCDCYGFIDIRMGDEGPLFFHMLISKVLTKCLPIPIAPHSPKR